MDFSTDILIDFGLNMAGYLTITLLVYVLTRLRRKDKSIAPQQTAINIPAAQPRPSILTPVRPAQAEPTFVSFGGERPGHVGPVVSAARPQVVETQPAPGTRQDNRRAIYREARQLLARGKSQSELLARLPLTEDEIEMLSIAGNA